MLVKDSQQGLGTAGKHLESLRTAADDLKKELECTRVLLNMATDKSTALQRECDGLKEQHEKALKEAEQKLISFTQQIRDELNKTWAAKISSECDEVRRKTLEQADLDKSTAIEQTIRAKNAELAAVRQGWEKKMSQLLDEISTLKRNLEAVERNASESAEKLRKDCEDENRRLRMELALSAEENLRKVDSMRTEYGERINALTREHEKRLQDLEKTLKQKYNEDMKAQLVAHKSSISMVRDDLEKEKYSEIERVLQQSQQDMVGLREELEQRFANEIDRLSRSHSDELEAARMELNRTVELSRLKDGEHAMTTAELEETIRHKVRTINGLHDELVETKNSLSNASKDLELRTEEIVRTRNEANQTLKSREDHLRRKHKQSLAEQQTNHQHQIDDMISEFNLAQDILKDKITQMQQMLEDAEEKYVNRESRDEDLEMIQRLRRTLQEKEEEVKRLIDDRRFYQLELVNRETNFNKVFNSDPKVGVLNPLAMGKKMKGKDQQHKDIPHRFSSGSSSSSTNMTVVNRLDPLPGSLLHEDKINTFRPLPPTKKMFLA